MAGAAAKAVELVFKIGEKFYKTGNKSIQNFIRGKGFKPLTKTQAAAKAERAIRIRKESAKKLDKKGLPQVPFIRSASSKGQSIDATPKPKLTKEMMVRAVSDKPKLKSPTPSRQGPPPPSKKVPARIKSPTSSRQVPSGGKNVPAKRSNTNLTKKPESKMKLALNKNKKTGKLRDGIIPASMAAIVVGDTLRNKKSNNNTGTATAKTQKKTINSVKPSGPKPNQNKVLDYTPSRGIPKSTTPSSPFGPVETRVRNKFIKDRGGKDAFKSDKQIDSLFVNEMFNMREGSEGGYTYDDQKDYEAILEERKSRKKAGGKVSKKVGGKVVKRNMGGPAKPRKKTVFRRGGGKALRGFGKATYSNKMY